MNSIAAGLLMLQVISSTGGTLAQNLLNNMSSHASVVSDIYFQDSNGKRVTSIDDDQSAAMNVYVKDDNDSDTQAIINLPAGVNLDESQTQQLNQATQAKVSYNGQKRQVLIDYSVAKKAADEVTAQQKVVSQAQSALTSAQKEAKTATEKAQKESVQVDSKTFSQQGSKKPSRL